MNESHKMQSMSREMGRIPKSERRKLFVSVLSDKAIKVIVSAIPTTFIGTKLVEYTLEQRGYFAVGGEWILMIMIFAAVYSILTLKKPTKKDGQPVARSLYHLE